jgi:hypothetical protein
MKQFDSRQTFGGERKAGSVYFAATQTEFRKCAPDTRQNVTGATPNFQKVPGFREIPLQAPDQQSIARAKPKIAAFQFKETGKELCLEPFALFRQFRRERQAAIKSPGLVKTGRAAPTGIVESRAAATTKSHGLIIEALPERKPIFFFLLIGLR